MDAISAIKAGLFVQFVANAWNTGSDTRNLTGLPVVDVAGNPVIAGSSYIVLKTLYACDLATDIQSARPGVEGWKTFGIVAANVADPDEIIIAIRGTETVWEWLQDAKFLLRPFTPVSGGGLAEDGFTDMYLSMSLTPAGSPGSCAQALAATLPPAAKVLVVGHSLGAAMATLLAFDLAANTKFVPTLYTLASPRVGDLNFMQVFNHVVPATYRVESRLDAVPKVPPPLMYFHVGDETELVPSLALRFDLACEHHLTSYFNMLGSLCGECDKYPLQPECLKGTPGLPATNPSAA